jgi:hypothetical protein
VDVFAVGEGDLLFGNGCLEGEHAHGASFWVGEAGEAKHRRDVGLIFFADFFHAVGVREVVVAIGQLDASLEEVGGVMVGVVEAGGDPEAEEIGCVEVGGVEGVDVGAEGEAESVGEFAPGMDGVDFGEVGLEGGEAVGFDGALVHVGVVEVGDLALVGILVRAGGGVGFDGVFDDASGLLEAAVGENAEDADSGAVGGEFGMGDEAAVGVEVEVVAGADGGIHVGDGDSSVGGLGGGGGLRLGWGG